MRVFHVLDAPAASPGDPSWQRARAFALRQQRRGHDVLIAQPALRRSGAPHPGRLVLALADGPSPLASGTEMRVAPSRLLSEHFPPDLIHVHGAGAGVAEVLRWARHRQVTCILDIDEERESSEGEEPIGVPAGPTWRQLAESCEVVLATTPDRLRRIQADAPGIPVSLLPVGIDSKDWRGGEGSRFRRSYGIPLDVPVLITVATIEASGGQSVALDALELVAEKHPGTRLVLWGRIADETHLYALRRSARARGLENSLIALWDTRPASPLARDVLAASQILLAPSSNDPVGFGVLIAWAAGIPVVAGRGVEEPQVAHGATGLRVDAADPRAYAFACARLLRDPEQGDRMAAEALQELERTRSWDALERRVAAIAASRLGEEFFGDGSTRRGALEAPWTGRTAPLRRSDMT